MALLRTGSGTERKNMKRVKMINKNFLSKVLLLLLSGLCWVSISVGQQQNKVASPDSMVIGDSLKMKNQAVPVGSLVPSIPQMATAPADTIGDEEERDSWENYGDNENLPWWLEFDSGREYDAQDPRDREQQADTRE
jgi:hypothetical protein